jgi:hypothetical protein
VGRAGLEPATNGFGDCLLLTLTYTDNGRRSILIDFGSTQLPRSAPPSRMADVATDITNETGGHLDMMVATHRHAALAATMNDMHAFAAGDASPTDLNSVVAPLFPDAVVELPKEAEWLAPRINRAYVAGMMSLLRVMDGVLNNTSVILLLQIGGTRLLLPGDAQIENWSYALFDAPNSEAIRAELSDTHLYKVGHHGSLNATPKTLWNHFEHRSTTERAPQRLISVVSTMAGKHGSPQSRTEVPRATLVAELEANSDFHSTQDHSAAKRPWVDVDVPIY